MSFLRDREVELPETATIVQVRAAYEAILLSTEDSGQDPAEQSFCGTKPSLHDPASGEPQEEFYADAVFENNVPKRGGGSDTGAAHCADAAQKLENSAVPDREIELARIRLETLRLQHAMEQKTVAKERIKIRLTDVDKIVGQFSGASGQNVKKWLNLVEKTVVSFGGGAQESYQVGRASLIGAARLHANNELWSDWQSFKAGLLDRFKESRSAMDVYDELRKRKRRNDESIEEYVLAMEVIADDLVVEADLVPLVIVGLCGNGPFAPMLAGATTIQQLRGLLPAYDRITKLTAASRGTGSAVGPAAYESRRRMCFNCKSEDGHIAAQCPKPQVRRPFSCFECGGTDHQLKACPKRRVGAVGDNAVVEPFTNVSIIFHCVTGSTKAYIKSLFDSGSPISLIEVQHIPKNQNINLGKLEEFGYNGLGNSKLKSFGKINL